MSELTFRERLAARSRESARDRFWDAHDKRGYACPCCGHEATGVKNEFEVHHRNGDWLDNRMLNLIAVCRPCHHRAHRIPKRHRRLEAWKKDFLELGEDGREAELSRISVYEDGRWVEVPA